MIMRWIAALLLVPLSLSAGRAGDIARAIRENSFDRDECYRVRDLTIEKEDLRIYLTDGHLIFAKPVAGRRIAAVFTADVEGGDAEIMLLPPDLAERRALASYIKSPNLDEHFRTAIFLFTGNDYDNIVSQFPKSPANRKDPEMAPLMDEKWTSLLRNIGESYQTRITLDLLGGPPKTGLFSALVNGTRLGNFDVVVDPDNSEQILAGQVASRDDRVYFDTWTSFRQRSARNNPAPEKPNLLTSNYRIEATVGPDLSMNVVTRVIVRTTADGAPAARFEISPSMEVSQVLVDGKPAEVLQRESLRSNLSFGGNGAFLVVPPEPMRAGRDYEFEFHHSGKVILDAGDRVFYVTARGFWYPVHGTQFTNFDMVFRYPQDLDLVAVGDVVEDRTDGDLHLTHRRTAAPVRMAGFNLGNYAHARVEKDGFTIDVCANRALERALRPAPVPQIAAPPQNPPRRPPSMSSGAPEVLPSSPTERLQGLASEVIASMEFMSSRFGPPALPHLTISPIPGTFGQGFPGLIYLSTLAYLKNLPTQGPVSTSQEIYFRDVLLAHEVAHQWWGNRVAPSTYRDNWLMEALANFSAIFYVEKVKGVRPAEIMLDTYKSTLLEKDKDGQTVESAGPIVLGGRLQNSLQPAGWRDITYGKGTWIMQMLRRRMGDKAFLDMLGEMLKRYERSEISTEQFRLLAASYMPPKSDDPKLESFFDQWIYGTGIPALKMNYTVKGQAPNLRLTCTVTQSDVDADFSAAVPVEVQVARGRTVTQWVRTGSDPATFTMALKAAPLKVSLDPNHAVLRK
jgi:hypothetical protein